MARSTILPTSPTSNVDCQIMGMGFGLEAQELIMKRKFRYVFSIPDVSLEGVNAIPHRKASRPGLSFKEQDCQHLSELVYFPLKADWKPIPMTLFDIKCNKNPVFDWLRRIYTVGDTDNIRFNPCQMAANRFKKNGLLELLDGCGNVLETWRFQNMYPNSIDWGDLDMESSEFVMVDMTLRYDRAFFE